MKYKDIPTFWKIVDLIFVLFIVGFLVFAVSCTHKSKYYQVQKTRDYFGKEIDWIRPFDCEVNKFFKYNNDYYLVKIVYDTMCKIDHLDCSPLHCDAYYELSKVYKSKYGYFYLPFGKPYKMEFANFGCWEDRPENIIKRAKQTLMSEKLIEYYQQKEIDAINRWWEKNNF